MDFLAPDAGQLVNVPSAGFSATDARELYRQKIARITLDSMVQFVGLLDAHGTVLEINQVALDAVGIRLSDVEGKPFWTSFWWQVSEEINSGLRDAILRAAQGEFVRWDTEIYGRAGGKETIVIDASLMPVKDVDGNVVFITAEGRDITEKKAHEREIARQREALAVLDEMKTRFFANISHEFRTPLTLIMGPLADAIADHDGLPVSNRERLQLAYRNSLRLLKLVNTLLDFSRIEAGRMQASYEPTSLSLLTAELASVFRSAIERAGMRLTIDCPPLAEMVYVDRDMWEKIVLNLLSNAFKFTFEGEIEVSLRRAGSAVELTVRDTGTGIPAEEIPHLFERFHRVRGAHGRSYEGSGIGLALVQELVKLHGGSVRVESETDRGSRFIVSLPLGHAHLPADRLQASRGVTSTAVAAQVYVDDAERWLPKDTAYADETALAASGAHPSVAAESATMPVPAKELILVADDNADMRDYLCRLLEPGYRVLTVRDGEQAVEAARRLRPALILTDVMMPNTDGFGLLRAIREDVSLCDIPVILLSARAGEESRVEGLHAGADDYLVKPFTARELTARVATHVKMANLRREIAEREMRLRAASDLERHRLQDLLAQAPAVIGLMTGPELRWSYVNEHLVRVAGRNSAADFVGKTFRESMPEAEQQGFGRLLDMVYRTGEPYLGKEVNLRLNRAATGTPEEIYFDFVYQPTRNADGEVEGILVHAVEVTDKVNARKEIEKSAERFELAQVAAQIGTWEWDPVKQVQTLSPELHRIFGTEPSDPDRVTTWASRVYPADWATVQRFMEDGYRAGEMEFEYRYEHPDTGLRWFYCKGHRSHDETRMFGIVQDTTARKVAEEASQRLAAIVESSDDAIISKDLNGIVTSWNPCAERMFGYTAEEIVGRPITTIIPPALQADETRILATIARGERIEHFETIRLKKNGEPIEVSLTVSPVKDEVGRIVGAAKIARDITQRKRTERALQTTERLASVGRLAATIAHEINNPLEAVTNLIYLAKHASAHSDVKKYLSIAEEEMERVSHLTRQTLGFYRETKGATRVRLSELVTSLLSVFASRTRNKGIELCPEINDDSELYAVPGEIRQVIANLIGNSIDALDAGGRVRIRVSAAAQWIGARRHGLRLTVADTGAGIPKSDRSQLFEPFFTTKKDVGTGLGLWVCKSIVENHHGSIRVRSATTPGKSWTVFSVFLPFNAQEAVAGEAIQQAV